MPKRIPGLAETILETATALFSRLGYDAVEMKQVAAEARTSVGNLYNYYPSKPALFLAIKKRWREDLIESFTEVLATSRPRREKILAILGRLYDDVSQWHGLWSEFLREKSKTDGGRPWSLGEEEKVVLDNLEVLLAGQPSPDGVDRWALVTITTTFQLAARYPQSRTQNWQFLEALVDRL